MRVKARIKYYFEVIKKYVFNSQAYLLLCEVTPLLRVLHQTYETQTPIKFSMWFIQKIIGINRDVYWPTHFTSQIGNWRNIYAGIETSPGYMSGCYIQGEGRIYVGDYTQIATNVGIITANHNLYDTRKHTSARDVKIGSYCWIGMNAIILPGVELGNFTVVGAGSVVTKSFVEGYCVIAGNPAEKIKALDRKLCVEYHSKYEYNGYIQHKNFEDFRKKNLNV